jgi:hypothetical protein
MGELVVALSDAQATLRRGVFARWGVAHDGAQGPEHVDFPRQPQGVLARGSSPGDRPARGRGGWQHHGAVSWHTPGGQGSVTPYLSPVSTMWWLGRSGCASTAGAQWRAVRIWMSSVHSGIGIAMADASPRCRSSRIWSRCWGHRPAPRPVGGPAHEHGACAIGAARGWLPDRSNGGAHLVEEARRARHALTGADDLDLDHAQHSAAAAPARSSWGTGTRCTVRALWPVRPGR